MTHSYDDEAAIGADLVEREQDHRWPRYESQAIARHARVRASLDDLDRRMFKPGPFGCLNCGLVQTDHPRGYCP